LCRGLAEHADNLVVPAVSDQHDRIALLGEPGGLPMHLAHQRAGGVDDLQVLFRRGRFDHRRYAMGAVHDAGARRNLVELVDKHDALRAKAIDDVLVVNDLVVDVERRPIDVESPLERRHRHVHAGAKTAGAGEQDFHGNNSGQL
jgi:hypothetical protein